MFEVGFSEILLIFAIALLVLGPNRLPKLAADLGRWAGRARAMARQLRTQLEQEVQFDPLKDPPAPPKTIHSPAPAPVADAPSPNSVPAEVAAGGGSAAAGSDAQVTESRLVADRTDEPKSA
jgi:Tat protein translocase TatB subunit